MTDPYPPVNRVETASGVSAKAVELENGESEPSRGDKPCPRRSLERLTSFYGGNSFLIKAAVAILLALAYPPLGAEYVRPKITATYIAVMFIFLMSGLGLKTEEFTNALKRVWFNLFVQCFNFFVVSALVFGATRGLISVNAIPRALADGMTICACLPMTVNMITVLTVSSGGDEASSVFNAAFGNGVGIFLSPVLIYGYIGVEGDVQMGQVFVKLAVRVLVPIVVGQLLQKFVRSVVAFVKTYKPYFKTVQEWCLVFIIYTVFCKTFQRDEKPDPGRVFLMIALQFVLLVTVMSLGWLALSIFYKNDPKLRVMGLFGCSHKTVAMGVPLINAIYENDSNVGLYTLPLLVWHPMQLLIGSALAPRLAEFVKKEEERLQVIADSE